MTNKELVQAMRTILIRPNIYRNDFPFNCCYYDGHFLSADCINVIKAILWNSDIVDSYEVGKYSYAPNATMGDWTERQIFDHCTETGADISKAPIGAYLLYEDEGHAGIYLGHMQAIEMTAGWNAHRMVISDIGPNGERKSNGVQIGRWKAWGKLPGVEYIVEAPELKVGDRVKLKANIQYDGVALDMNYLNKHPLEVQLVNGELIYVKRTDKDWTECVMWAKDVEKAVDPVVGDRVKLLKLEDINGTKLAVWLKLKQLEVQSFWPDGAVVIGQVGKNYPECVMSRKNIEIL